MTEVKFYESVADELLKFAGIIRGNRDLGIYDRAGLCVFGDGAGQF